MRLQGPARPIPISPRAIVLAQELHDEFERRALDELGYPPRLWDTLNPAEQQLRAEAVQEKIDRGVLFVLPDCPHPPELRQLVRREMTLCGICNLPVTMLSNISKGVM